MLLVQEVLEASNFLALGHFSQRTVTGLADEAKLRVRSDPGFAPGAMKNQLMIALANVHSNSIARRQLEIVISEMRPLYLESWRAHLLSPGATTNCELIARSLASHMLSLGFSPEKLHQWLQAGQGAGTQTTIEDVIVGLTSLEATSEKDYNVLIPIERIRGLSVPAPETWLDNAQAKDWVEGNVGSLSLPPRQSGAFVFQVAALDEWAATEKALECVRQMRAQVSVGHSTVKSMEVGSLAFVSGIPTPMKLPRLSREVNVLSLKRGGMLFDHRMLQSHNRLRSAIDLLDQLESAPIGSAISCGWAAIEALLKRPDETTVQAAVDLASVIACSWPRAELTPLCYEYVKNNSDELAAELAAADTNRERCRLMLEAAVSNPALSMTRESSEAALMRMRDLAMSQTETLQHVRDYVASSLIRLYRQRNLILHGGFFDSLTRTTTLRCAPPLVGAGFDRIVHFALTNNEFEPDRLIAEANLAIGTASGRSVSYLTQMLER
jgi:hypothetical protein